MRRLHIFRAGKRTDSAGLTLTYSEADLAGIAATYDPALHEAPIVVGHPRLDAPAYGWIRGVAAQGEELQAEPHQVETTFSEMVQAGRFKHISAAFYLPESPSHPIRKSGGEPQFPYLKHVGFLGAAAPAVPGLKPVEFSAQEEGVAEFASDLTTSWVARLVRGLREWMIAKHGMEDADQVVAAVPQELGGRQVRLDDGAVLGYDPNELLLPTDIDEQGVAYFEIRPCRSCDILFGLSQEESESDEEPAQCPDCR